MNSTTIPVRFAKPFSAEQLANLLAAADDFERTFKLPGGDIQEREFWKAFVLARHSTGLSSSQLLALRWTMIEPTGRIPFDVRLSRQALFAVASLCSLQREFVFTWPESSTFDFQSRWRMLRSFAAIDCRDGKDGGQ